MAIAIVASSSASALTAGITTPIAPTNGNVLVLALGNKTVNVNTTAVSSPHATWTKIGSFKDATHPSLEIWAGAVSAPSGAEVISVTWSTAGSPDVMVAEYSGLSTTIDGTAATNSGTSASASTAAYSTTNANDLVLACVSSGSSIAPSNPATGTTPTWTSLSMINGGSGGAVRSLQTSYAILSATGAQSAAWTIGNAIWTTLVVALQATAAAATNPTDFLGQMDSRTVRDTHVGY